MKKWYSFSNILFLIYILTIYKSFLRTHLGYGDLIHDQLSNASLSQKIESIQCNAAIVITGTIRGTSQLKLYGKLVLNSLKFRRWFRRLTSFYKLITSGLPKYLINLIPHDSNSYNVCSTGTTRTYYCWTDVFKYSYFPFTKSEWNYLDFEICKSKIHLYFRNKLLKLVDQDLL